MKTKVIPSRLLAEATLVTCLALALSGCDKPPTAIAGPTPVSVAPIVSEFTANTSQLCVFSNDESAAVCKSGQTALFAPETFGNEQLPVIFAAKYCDFSHPIALTKGAVSCVFFKDRRFYKPEVAKTEQDPSHDKPTK